jgi:hypothetical protein
MKMGNDQVRVGNVDINPQRGEKQPGHAADCEQADESDGVEHRRIPGD